MFVNSQFPIPNSQREGVRMDTISTLLVPTYILGSWELEIGC
jgi:hypothetical protein